MHINAQTTSDGAVAPFGGVRASGTGGRLGGPAANIGMPTGGSGFDVVEEYQGTGSTDFWGISFAFSSVDRQAMSQDELERELRLMRACWAYFDHVRSRVSAELQKGPRGGGRDRDQIVRHVVASEQDMAKKTWRPSTGPQSQTATDGAGSVGI